MGKPGFVAQKISATLASTGTPSHYLHPAEAAHGDLGRIAKDDVVLALSNSGETEEILRLLPALKKIGARVVALTRDRVNPLARGADLVVAIGDVEEACPMGLAPTASTAVLLAVGDALAMTVLANRPFEREEYALFHPGGKLGRGLMKVRELMRGDEANPVVREDAPLSAAVAVMTETPGRPGATAVVDAAGRLVGIFTDGDLATPRRARRDRLHAPGLGRDGPQPAHRPARRARRRRRARAAAGAHRPGAGRGRRGPAGRAARRAGPPRREDRVAPAAPLSRRPRAASGARRHASADAAAGGRALRDGARRGLPPATRARPHRRGRGKRLRPARPGPLPRHPSGVNKGYLAPGDLVVVDGRGRGRRRARPRLDRAPHAPRRLRARGSDVAAVVHAHPITAVALTVAGVPPPNDLVPEAAVTLGEIAVAPFATPGTDEVPASLAPLSARHDVVLLERHGALALGRTLDEAFDRMETLERVARVAFVARLARRVRAAPGRGDREGARRGGEAAAHAGTALVSAGTRTPHARRTRPCRSRA